jgi:hypothetical protein
MTSAAPPSSAHGPLTPFSSRHSATTPATCGVAMLVPEIVV